MKRIHFGLAHTFRTPEAVQRYIQQYNGTEGMVASVVMMITANAISYYKDHELALIMEKIISTVKMLSHHMKESSSS